MECNERTRDIYERIPGFEKPPLVPLPELDDLSSLEKFGLTSTRLSNAIVRAAMRTTGFAHFYRQLPTNLEDVLRTTNIRGPFLYSPVISATLALKDDPRNLLPLERAASLVIAGKAFYDDLISSKITPDRYRNTMLEMGQYPNLFSTSLVVEGKKPRIYKSTNSSHITVVVNRSIYILDIFSNGKMVSLCVLTDILDQ